ncbi:hypothetical protein [Actinomadura sp. 7K534]|uniref:hypothetical protein n=1 Tax=Actinomadura sp. 7K534 TaxID=2530366 RepID=UPI001048E275|nr:hypothetical protein [Actinomadura sp. 7K534]TDB92375.1 hypothetical protein E1266_24485 [Actinomadura sp. 7K534]
MAIQAVRAAAGLARSMITRKVGGLWQVLRAYVEGRNAVSFERERRTTLLTVSQVLPPGTCLYDQRADGGVLKMQIAPVTRIDLAVSGGTAPGLPQYAVPACRPRDRGSIHSDTGTARLVEE